MKNKTALAFSSALLASSLTQADTANTLNPFSLNEISGYATPVDKDGEGKCGEGKCGEGKCGEGKCGEGKCGGDSEDKTLKKKSMEGKCGEGKCGS